jgi:hypothetical protein
VSAEPLTGVVGEVGGLYIIKGESTEITTYDDDGYIMGERITLRRPQNLFFDEVSFANAYFVSSGGEISVGKRLRHIDEPNYRHVLVSKKMGGRGAVSGDFTLESGRRTWRQAVTLEIPEVRVVDSVVFEQYERTNADPAVGFAVTFAKRLTSRVSLNQFGYARIDSGHGGLNADRFHVGNRAFVMATYEISPEVTASFFITTAVGGNDALAQRTLSNTAVTYNALPALKRTGWF